MARPPRTSTAMATAIPTEGIGKCADAYPVYMENAAILPIPLKIKIALRRIRPASDTTLFEEFIRLLLFFDFQSGAELRQVEQQYFRAFGRFHANFAFFRNGSTVALLQLSPVQANRSARHLKPGMTILLEFVLCFLAFVEARDVEIRVLMNRDGCFRARDKLELPAQLRI